MASPQRELEDKRIGELWRRYRPLQGKDAVADLVLALIRKLVIVHGNSIPYGYWEDRLTHPLRTYGISKAEWER